MTQQEFKLTQTTSSFTFVGIVDGMTNDNAYREDEIKQGKNQGKEYRSIRFFVQTSPTNKLPVEMFGMELDWVYPYKKGKKGEKGTTKKMAFDQRDNLPEGFHIIGINLGLEKNAAGKNIRKSLVDFDAVEYIYDNLNDGDSVEVSGELQFSQYENSQGELIDQTKYIIKSIYLEKEAIDFTSEKFQEVNAFEQELVFIDKDVDKKESAVYVSGYTIQYGDKFSLANFVIRPNGNENIEKTAKAFAKALKFGDTLKVYGLCLNKAETVEVDVADDETKAEKDDIFGGEKPKGLEKRAVTTYVTELQITGADNESYKAGKGMYKEEDFVVEELVDENDSDDDDDDNLFGEDSGQEIDDDDLPF